MPPTIPSGTGEVSAVSTHWGIHEDVYCAVRGQLRVTASLAWPSFKAAASCALHPLAPTPSLARTHSQGNDGTFTFLEAVLDQVVAQFPCPYIHIGGDEVPKVRRRGERGRA